MEDNQISNFKRASELTIPLHQVGHTRVLTQAAAQPRSRSAAVLIFLSVRQAVMYIWSGQYSIPYVSVNNIITLCSAQPLVQPPASADMHLSAFLRRCLSLSACLDVIQLRCYMKCICSCGCPRPGVGLFWEIRNIATCTSRTLECLYGVDG